MQRKNTSERGNSILEFALVAGLFLVPMLAGSYTLGMSLVKALQVQQVCRDANILTVRNIDLSRSDNQSLVVRTAAGLGMNITGTNNPNPSGLGVVILSTVHRVSDNDCLAQGQPANSTCTNWHYYVFTRRITIGNTAKLTSTMGNPGDTVAGDGTLTPAQYVLDSGNRATGFPPISALLPTDAGANTGLVFLPQGTDAYIAEAAFDISAMNVFSTPRMGTIYARHIS
ncbi:MAG TPA: hypothetical protein VMJ34_17325 [Bryobacteraceae bacterium]|nr:hypothetical protein [Bryobacteraceae bacterium]